MMIMIHVINVFLNELSNVINVSITKTECNICHTLSGKIIFAQQFNNGFDDQLA